MRPAEFANLVDPSINGRVRKYPEEATAGRKPVPYHGYLFKVLRAQGPAAEGGEKDYVRNGLMTEGCSFLAWPARFGNSGMRKVRGKTNDV